MSPIKNQPPNVIDVTPELAEQWVRDEGALVVDVREDYEYAAENIDGSFLAPLSEFDPDALRAEHGDRRLVFQ